MHLPGERPVGRRLLLPVSRDLLSGTATAPASPRQGAGACAVPIAPWRSGWGRRHYAATGAALPLAWWAYAQAAAPVTGPWWVASIALLATAAAIVVATYLPRSDGLPKPPAAPCAASPLAQLVLAGVFLSLGGVLGHVVALLAVGAAVLQRTTGASTCSVGPGLGEVRTDR